MQIYIDESGSITCNYYKHNPYFIIALIRPLDKEKLQKVYKRFVSSNFETLKSLDTEGKMFKNGKFHELKGNQFDKPLKKKFVDYFCRNNLFEIYIIKVNNAKLTPAFCKNTARAFNYVLVLALKYFISNGLMIDEPSSLQLDERNEKTEAKFFLENYINTELTLSGVINHDFTVQYFDSANNHIIQIADVFANLFFSQCITGSYDDEIKYLKENGYLKFIFEFPL